MTAMFLIGVLLLLVGLVGSAQACMAGPNDSDVTIGGLAGASMAVGLVCMALSAAKHGYHRRPLGAPPGDMDPDKADLPAPVVEIRKGDVSPKERV